MQTLGTKKRKEHSASDLQKCPGRSVGVESIAEHTAIELTGTDRPGLLSEVSAVLTNTQCNVNAAEVWTHNSRVACVVYVTDGESGGPVKDEKKLNSMRELLSNVMGSDGERRGAKTNERGYVLVNIQCRDQPKLLFDTVCALTDMQFVVFHATISCSGFDAVQVLLKSQLSYKSGLFKCVSLSSYF
jgi:UTP:GlnB (protein PII) uridylyltransferase